jgi:hypothetical protein
MFALGGTAKAAGGAHADAAQLPKAKKSLLVLSDMPKGWTLPIQVLE